MVWRISDRATFELLRTQARRARVGPVSVAFCPADQADEAMVARVAYSVGKKAGGAVQRNRLRRRLRASVAEISPGLVPGAYLVSVRTEAAALPFEKLRETVAQAICKVTKSDNPK